MKHLPIHSKEYKLLLKDFKAYLQRIGYSKNSLSSIPSALQEFFYSMEKSAVTELLQISSDHIIAHYHYLSERPNHTRSGGLSNSVIQSHLGAIKLFFSYQEQQGKILSNPASTLSFKRLPNPERRVLTKEEIKTLYDTAENLRDRALLGLFYGCGLRKSEAKKLNIEDIHFKSGLLYVREGKGKKRRVVPLSSKVVEDLKSYYHYERNLYVTGKTKETQAFMLGNRGTRMQSYCERLKYLLEKAKLPLSFSLHHLRHSIATHLLEKGLELEKVRDFLGHNELETTQIYTHISKKYLHSQGL